MTTALLGFVFALAESGLGLGAIFPGEVAISGLAAQLDGVGPLVWLGIAVAVGACAGDHLGFVVGRLGGTRLRESGLVRRLGVDRWDRAADLVQQHGFWALLASRLLPVVRTVMPVVAGAARVPYRHFLPASVLGAVAWSTVWVVTGAGVGASGVLHHPRLWISAAVLAAVALAVRAVVAGPTPTACRARRA